jgi:hypothetical protein
MLGVNPFVHLGSGREAVNVEERGFGGAYMSSRICGLSHCVRASSTRKSRRPLHSVKNLTRSIARVELTIRPFFVRIRWPIKRGWLSVVSGWSRRSMSQRASCTTDFPISRAKSAEGSVTLAMIARSAARTGSMTGEVPTSRDRG